MGTHLIQQRVLFTKTLAAVDTSLRLPCHLFGEQLVHLSFWQTCIQQLSTSKSSVDRELQLCCFHLVAQLLALEFVALLFHAEPFALPLLAHRLRQYPLRALKRRRVCPRRSQSSSLQRTTHSRRRLYPYLRLTNRNLYSQLNPRLCSQRPGVQILHFFFSWQLPLPDGHRKLRRPRMVRASHPRSLVFLLSEHVVEHVIVATHTQHVSFCWPSAAINRYVFLVRLPRHALERERVVAVLLEPRARRVEAALQLTDLRADVGVLSVVDAVLPHDVLDLGAQRLARLARLRLAVPPARVVAGRREPLQQEADRRLAAARGAVAVPEHALPPRGGRRRAARRTCRR